MSENHRAVEEFEAARKDSLAGTLAGLIERYRDQFSATWSGEGRPPQSAIDATEALHAGLSAALRVSGPVRWGRWSHRFVGDADRDLTETDLAHDEPSAYLFDEAGVRIQTTEDPA